MRMRKLLMLVSAGVLILCSVALGSGMMIPKREELPPLGVKTHRGKVRIKDGVATTELTEVFLNSTKRQLEATYVFPIPADAALSDFALYINGKRTSGKVIDADQARQTYEEIVRRMRDPGLLEYIGRGMLKMRVFPIPPESTQKIEVRYSESVPFDGGLYRYTFPLRTGDKASRVLEDFAFEVDIQNRHGLANIYSPSHKIGVSRKGEHHAVVGFEGEEALLDEDFQLYFSVTDKQFGLNLLTHRTKGEDGYFALMLSPRVGLKADEVMPKDVCFLLDVSGSMNQQKRIENAKDALRFCLNSLNGKDRFALISFSTGVEAFREGLSSAEPDNVKQALAAVDDFEARGGTNLCGALVKGLKLAPEDERPYIVVLITDGKPTIGTVEPESIITEVKAANKQNIRVFSFGIAESLDVPLLDSIAEVTGGYSQYVAPGQEIEAGISRFFRKVSHPVLTQLSLDFGRIRARDQYPQNLPDLFRGSQLVVFGRYSGSGEVAVRLEGRMKKQTQTFAYDARFPSESPGNPFVAQLWAQRKIAYLLDEIRLHGETKELKDEVVRLSKEYGIATPYTSYLVLENEKQYVEHGLVRRRAAEMARKTAPAANRTEEDRADREQAAEALSSTGDYLSGRPGAGARGTGADKRAVDLSETMRRWKSSESRDGGGLSRVPANMRKVGPKTFVRVHGVYVDTSYEGEEEELRIRWGSPAYFALLRAVPALKPYLSLGTGVILVHKGTAILIGEEGREELDEANIRELLPE